MVATWQNEPNSIEFIDENGGGSSDSASLREMQRMAEPEVDAAWRAKFGEYKWTNDKSLRVPIEHV